ARERKLCMPADPGDRRFEIHGLIPLRLADEDAGLQKFETIVARFDGSQFWFDARDERADPTAADYLRQALAAMVPPEKLARAGLSSAQREAYVTLFRHQLEQEQAAKKQLGEYRLREALSHAGAPLRDFAELRDGYRVSYDVDGRRHTS